AIASGRIEIIIILFMDWSFASGCAPPRLSATQLPSATDKPVFLSDRDFHPTVGAYSQAHSSTAFRALAPTASFRGSLTVNLDLPGLFKYPLKILMHGVWGAMEHFWNAFHCSPNPYILKVKKGRTQPGM